MTFNYSICCEEIDNKIIVLEEKKVKFYLNNDMSITLIKLDADNCLKEKKIYPDSQKLSDWVIWKKDDSSKNCIIVELKGSDIKHAIEQIQATIKNLLTKINKKCIIAYVICNRNPLATTETQKLKREFKKSFTTTDLRIERSMFKENVSKIIYL